MDIARRLRMSLGFAAGMLLLATSFAYAGFTGTEGAVPTTGTATDITATSATLNGSAGDAGFYSSYSFEYGTTTAYGSVSAIPDSPHSCNQRCHKCSDCRLDRKHDLPLSPRRIPNRDNRPFPRNRSIWNYQQRCGHDVHDDR